MGLGWGKGAVFWHIYRGVISRMQREFVGDWARDRRMCSWVANVVTLVTRDALGCRLSWV